MEEIKESTLETAIDRVVVYLDGARIFRSGRLSLETGTHKVRIPGLTKFLIKDSVRVSGRGKGVLGAVDVQTLYQEEVAHEALKGLMEEEEKLTEQLETLQEKLAFADRQKQVLDELGTRFASEFPAWLASGDSSLESLAEFYKFEEKRNNENLAVRRKLSADMQELARKLEALRAQINMYRNPDRVEQTTDVVVSIEVREPGPFTVELSYQSQGVNWKPGYDVDLKAEKAHIKGIAGVYNGTLENWTDVELQISTAVFKPVRVVAPQPFYVDIYQPQIYESARMAASVPTEKLKKAAAAEAPEGAGDEYDEEEVYGEELAVPEAIVRESPAGVQSFDVAGKWSIPSDGDTHPVTLATYELPTKKRFYWCASDSNAVIAVDRITNGDGVLLAGKARVYSEGEFVGETIIGQIAPGEEFELGAREELKIKAEKKLQGRLKERTGLMRGKRSMGYKYSLVVKNFRKEKSEINVKDVIPYSQSERIKIKWLECSVRPEDDNLGIYTWKLVVEPGAEKSIGYTYDVEWEKDFTISPPLP